MIISGYAKTDLAEQERVIAEWKKENGYVADTPITNNALKLTRKQSNTFLFDHSPEHIERQKKLREEQAARRELGNTVTESKKGRKPRIPQSDLMAKYEAQKRGDIDPNYYYSLFDGRVKRKSRNAPATMIDPAKHKPFKGQYGKLKGNDLSQKIIVLLGQHDVIDINALINEHNLNRNTFLQTAKKLEKADLLRIVKANGRGKTAKFLERVA
nr:hypothetical protein [Moraxella sp. CTOTU48268]